MRRFQCFFTPTFFFILGSMLITIPSCSTTREQSLEDRMFHAVMFEHEEIAGCVREGQDVNAIQRTGSNYSSNGQSGLFEIDRTYLSIAVRHGRTESVKALLANGADPELGVATMGYTSLAWAVRAKNVEMVSALLQAGADPNRRSKTPFNEGQYPLIWAVRKDCPEAMKLLLDRGADAGVSDADGMSCADIAERWKRQEILDVLAQHDHATSVSPNKVQ